MSLLFLAGGHIDRNGYGDDDARDDLLIGEAQADEVEAVGNRLHQDGAYDRIDHGAAAAPHAGAADDDRRDAVHAGAGHQSGLGGGEAGNHQHAA